MNEIWKTIPEFPMFEASTLGNIRRKGWKKNRRFSIDKDGYLFIYLWVNKTLYVRKVHRLILMTFKPTNNKELQVNHINENKADNRLENLEWVTPKQNVSHSASKIYHDSITHRMKPVLQYSLNGEFIKEWESARQAARELGLKNNSHIGDCCNGRIKKFNGFVWKWKEDEPIEVELTIRKV